MGKLARVSFTPAGGDVPTFVEAHAWEGEGGEVTATLRVMGGQAWWTSRRYDAFGRPARLLYPATEAPAVTLRRNTDGSLGGLPAANARPAGDGAFAVTYGYRRGTLTHVANAATGVRYWQLAASDAAGRITRATLGNGLETGYIYDRARGVLEAIHTGQGGDSRVQDLAFAWDLAGNLTRREDRRLGHTERFGYDPLYRLTRVEQHLAATRLRVLDPAVAADALVTRLAYDALGNLTAKGGTYTDYRYGSEAEPGVRPHAVRRLTVHAEGTSHTRTYTYDANGNLLQGGGTTVRWTSYNKPQAITANGHASYFAYGPDRARYWHRAETAAGVTTTWYVGGLYERVTDSSGTEHRHYIRAGGRVVAVHKEHPSAAGPAPFAKGGRAAGAGGFANPADRDGDGIWTEYLHRDHQGSITALTDADGAVLTRFSYDAWGKRRAAIDWHETSPGDFLTPQAHTTRGYTGHEHLDHVGLIHMNGRVYDPEIGRFLSADPYVQFPESTQGLNRYSYVGNNPLSYSDPSGFFLDGLLDKVVGLVGVALNFVPGCQFWCQVGWSAVAGGVSGYMATGNFEGAIRGAVTNAAITAVGHNLGAGGKGANAANDSWNFHKVFDVATQTVGVFNPKAAAKLAILNGAIYHGRSGPLAAGKFLADSYVKHEVVTPALRKYANRRGLSLTELNVGLAALSLAGNEIVGSRYDREEDHFRGWANRGPAGLLFDVIDTGLAYQGLPTASSIEYILDENSKTSISGHSLGSMDANNLVSQGFAKEASLMALPFGNSGMLTNGSSTELVPMDFVSGFVAGWMLNPTALVSKSATFDHSCTSFQNCPYPN